MIYPVAIFVGKARYDLLSAVMVCIGKASGTESDAPLHKLLATILSGDMPVTEKTTILQEEFDIPTWEVEEVLNTMCNLSDRIESQGIEKGIEKGRILQLSELVEDGVISLEEAASKAGLSAEEFKKKLSE